MKGMKFSLYENTQWIIGELYLIELVQRDCRGGGGEDNELEDQEVSFPERNTEKGENYNT